MLTKYFCLAALIVALPLAGEGPSFIPDSTFKGSNLQDWHPLGQAKWHATNGQLTGKSDGQRAPGGWFQIALCRTPDYIFNSGARARAMRASCCARTRAAMACRACSLR